MAFLELQYQHGCYLEEKKIAFLFSEVSTIRKNVRVEQNENLEKEILDWFKITGMSILPMNATVLKEKTIRGLSNR